MLHILVQAVNRGITNMYIPPGMVKVLYDAYLKEMGFDSSKNSSKHISEWEYLSWSINDSPKKKRGKRLRQFFNWLRLVYLYRKLKAFVIGFVRPREDDAICHIPTASLNHKKIENCE